MTLSNNVTEVARLERTSGPRSESASSMVNCRVESHVSFEARVVFMAHRHHDLWEQRVVVRPGQSITISCPKGEVVVVVFNVEDDSFYLGTVIDVAGSFTFPIN